MADYSFGRTSNVDRFRSRIDALGRVFAKTDRIITGRREVTVRMETTSKNQIKAPGFSDGQNVTINYDRIPDVSKPVGLVRLMAVNYHELSHLLFTPRDSAWREQIASEGNGWAFNVLEDQRIETLFVAKYRPAAKYFTEMNVQLFLADPKKWETAMLFTHGRRYLPLDVRQQLDDAFAGDAAMKKRAKRFIDEYRLLAMTSQNDLDRGMVIIQEFQKLIDGLQNDGHQVAKKGENTCTDNHGDNGKMDKSLANKTSEDAREDTEEQDDQEEQGEDGSGFWDDVDNEEDDDDESASGEPGDDDDEDGEDDGEDYEDSDGDDGAGDDPGDEEGDSDAGDDHGDDDSDGDRGDRGEHGDATPNSEAGGSPTDGVTPDLRDLINEVLEAIKDSQEVQNDIANIQNAMSQARDELDAVSHPGHLRAPSPDEMSSALSIENEFRRLHAMVEPGWNYGSDHGRLNVQRAIDASSSPFFDSEDLFDEWDEGREDEVGVEAFIDVDLSGSLGWAEQEVSGATWIMKRALDAIDAESTVAGFHYTTSTLYQRGERCHPTMVMGYRCNGGDTAPMHSMKAARRILNQSDKPHRIFVIITDGAWSTFDREDDGLGDGGEGYEDVLGEMDATKVFIGIGGASNAYPEFFHHSFNVNNVAEIPEKFRGVVTTILSQTVAGRRL